MTPAEAAQINEALRVVLNRNIDNRLTHDLASGVYQTLTTVVNNLIELPQDAKGDTE